MEDSDLSSPHKDQAIELHHKALDKIKGIHSCDGHFIKLSRQSIMLSSIDCVIIIFL